MQIPCANFTQCTVPLIGVQHGRFVGHFTGFLDADFNGTVRGVFIGEMRGYFCGTMNGVYHGLINGVQFDGAINQYVCGQIDGNFAGNVDGQFNGAVFRGHLIGFLDADIDAQIDGTTIATFVGTIDGFPTDPDFPVNNVSSENPDVGIGFPTFDHEGGTLPPGMPTPPTTTPTVNDIILYPNEEQSYTITCDDLTEYTAVVPADNYRNAIAAQANADALAYAQHLAEVYCIHHVPVPSFTNTPQTCVITCPSGATSRYTADVRTWFDDTQDLANAGAMEFACVMAQIFCPMAAPPPSLPPGSVPPGGGGPSIPPANGLPDNLPPGPSGLFANSEQTATVDCPNGGTFAYTTKTGQFFGSSAALANAAALSYALDQAMTLRFCFAFADNRGNQGFHAISDFRIAINDTYAGALITLERTGVNTLYNFLYTFVVTGAPPWQPSAFIPPPGVVILGAAPEWTFQYGSATERAVAITAGQYATIFTIAQDRPTYRILATRTMPFYVGQIATDSQLPDASVGGAYDVQLATEFMLGPFDWRLADDSPELPDGLTMNANGLITGMATTEDTVTIDVEVTDAAYVTTHKQFDISVVANCISNTSPLSAGSVGTPYSVQLLAPGLTAPLNWTNTGALPAGLTLNQDTGFITGTPTTAVNVSFQANVIDDNNVGCNKVLSINIASTPPPPGSCGWWADFPWAVDFADGDPSGSAVVTPSGDLTGVTTINFVVLQPGPDPAWGGGVQSEVSGTKSYTGSPLMVHIKVFVNSNPGLNAPIEVFVLSGQQGLILDENVQDPGTHDWDIFIREGTLEDWFIFFNVVTDSELAAAALDYTITLTSSEADVDDSDGWYFMTGTTPKFLFATSTVDNPSTTITLLSNTLRVWNLTSNFDKTSWAVAPLVQLDGVTMPMTDNGAFWTITAPTITTQACTQRLLTVSGPTVATPFGLTTNYIYLIPQN